MLYITTSSTTDLTTNPATNPISPSTRQKPFKSYDGGLVADLRFNPCFGLLFFAYIMCLGTVAISGRYQPWLLTLYEECEGRGMLGGERKKMIDEKKRRRG